MELGHIVSIDANELLPAAQTLSLEYIPRRNTLNENQAGLRLMGSVHKHISEHVLNTTKSLGIESNQFNLI